jgi:DNA-binding transcriptional LysR family regulator
MISSIALRYFAGVRQYGSIRAAAESLFVAPSAISRQISLLEEEIGAPLYERGRGKAGLRLTAAGEVLLQYVLSSDNELRRVKAEIEALKGLRKGEIRLGIPETFSKHFMPDFLLQFNERYPHISYHVHVATTPALLELLGADELDLALAFNPPEKIDISHVFKKDVATCILVSENHPLAHKESVRLSDCANYGMALPDASLSAKRKYDEMFAKAKIRPRPILITNSYELTRNVARAGLAIAIVNRHIDYKSNIHIGYRYIPIVDKLVRPQRFALCIRSGRNLSVVALTFIDQLKQAFESMEIV